MASGTVPTTKRTPGRSGPSSKIRTFACCRSPGIPPICSGSFCPVAEKRPAYPDERHLDRGARDGDKRRPHLLRSPLQPSRRPSVGVVSGRLSTIHLGLPTHLRRLPPRLDLPQPGEEGVPTRTHLLHQFLLQGSVTRREIENKGSGQNPQHLAGSRPRPSPDAVAALEVQAPHPCGDFAVRTCVTAPLESSVRIARGEPPLFGRAGAKLGQRTAICHAFLNF